MTILDDYRSDSRVRVRSGNHLGASASYFDLLAGADSGGLVAFCDQDDVWLPGKLSRAASCIDAQPADRPVLYCSRQVVVDADLGPIGVSRAVRRGPSFNNALVENIAAGCTVVINEAARALLVSRLPGEVVMHDSWAYLVIAAFGRVIFDEEPHILYRQHAGNAVGEARRAWSGSTGRVGRLLRRDYQSALLRQALAFERHFGDDLNDANARLLRRFIDRSRTWGHSLGYAWRPDVCRQASLDDAILRVLIGLRYV